MLVAVDRVAVEGIRYGSRITLKQVKQVTPESGWTSLREALSRVYVISAASFRPRDEWLTQQLLAQVQGLVERLEALGGLTPEQQMTLADLEALCDELDFHLRELQVHKDVVGATPAQAEVAVTG